MRDFSTDKRQVISTKNVLDILRSDSNQRRTKSASNPPAQITNQCEGSNQLSDTIQAFRQCQEELRVENKELYFLITLQFENALRISEVISINPYNIDQLGNVLIKTAKGSKPKIIASGVAREFMLNCRKYKICPFAHYNRFYLYRLYKKYNLLMLLPNRTRFAVTHTARHIAAMAARNENFEESVLQSHLSHKSKNSTKHYGK